MAEIKDIDELTEFEMKCILKQIIQKTNDFRETDDDNCIYIESCGLGHEVGSILMLWNVIKETDY